MIGPAARIIVAVLVFAFLLVFWNLRPKSEISPPLVFQLPAPEASPAETPGLSWQFLPPIQDSGKAAVLPRAKTEAAPSPPTPFTLLPEPTLIPAPAEFLTLPLVSETELNIGLGGASNLSDYLDLFVSNVPAIKFELQKFEKVKHGPEGIIYLPNELVELGLESGDLLSIKESLSILKEFLLAKIDYLKGLRVSGAAVQLNSYMIGIDLLTAELIDKALKAADGTLAITELKSHYEKYQNTVSAYQERFKSGNLLSRDSDSLKSFFRFLGLRIKKVIAQTSSPFGGYITGVDECTCLGGYVMFLSPGFIGPAPGSYTVFISYATAASPLLFLYKQATPGHWILGNYAPTGGVCLTGRFCSPSAPFIGTVKMAGTS